ncbi:MAG: glycosyltransferase [Weeksellaceae bacterium]
MNNPLVSIVVITYNSSKYVLETLESAKAQTYQNIELIVTDDGSTDNTIEICQQWIDENKKRFVRTEMITVEKNTGIPANCNRGVKAAKGEWIKLIAGDDVLLDNNIRTNLKFNREKGSKITFSKMIYVGENTNKPSQLDRNQSKFLSTSNQYRYYLRFPLFINVPTLFYHRTTYDSVGGFYEEIKLLEDQPFILKVLKHGIKIHYIDEITVKYRISENSISSKAGQKIYNDLLQSFVSFREEDLKRGNFVDRIYLLAARLNFHFKRNPKHSIGKKNFDRLFNLLLRIT